MAPNKSNNTNGDVVASPPDTPPPAPEKQPLKRVSSLQRMRQRLRRRRGGGPNNHRRRLLEDHYRIDNEKRALLPGVPHYDPDWARDSHDLFNLVVLVPVVALNVMNWNWDLILNTGGLFGSRSAQSMAQVWTGQYFDAFFLVTALYFVIDLIWILLVPSAVKSPSTIVQHHIATMLYILIPYKHPQYQWCMGACMMVEINTWFLIARRVFNKQGFPPWILNLSVVSIRVKLISVCFYVTWLGIRCLMYPALMWPFVDAWLEHSQAVGTKWNVVGLSVPLHTIFCLLNFKWSYDLLMSKIRYWRRKGTYKQQQQQDVSKGL